jgi:hypothetical protein
LPLNVSLLLTLILFTTLAALLLLAIVMGTIHVLRRRAALKTQAIQQADVEKSLRRARRPVLVVDTDVVRPQQSTRKGRREVVAPGMPSLWVGGNQMSASEMRGEEMVPPVPSGLRGGDGRAGYMRKALQDYACCSRTAQ